MTDERPSGLSPGPSIPHEEVFDYQGDSSVADSSLALSPEPSNLSLTFVTPSSSIFTTPQSSLSKPTAHDEFLPGTEPEPTPSTGDVTASEEKPSREEKPVTSTPYLGLGSLRDSIGKRVQTGSRLHAWPPAVTPGESFIHEEIGRDFFRSHLPRYVQD